MTSARCEVESFKASNSRKSVTTRKLGVQNWQERTWLSWPTSTTNPRALPRQPPRHASGQRPEVRILTRENEELTSDALSVNGFQQYQAKDYRLVHAPFMGSSEKGGQWSAGDEPLYYIVSPKVSCPSLRSLPVIVLPLPSTVVSLFFLDSSS